MLQIINQLLVDTGSGTTAARYSRIFDDTAFAFDTPEAYKTTPWSVTGTFQNWSLKLSAAPGVGNSYTFVVRINGVDSGLTITISDAATSGSDTTHTASISAGDVVTIKRTGTGSPASVSTIKSYLEFSAASNKSCYVHNGTHPGFPGSNPTAYGPFLFSIVTGSGAAWDNADNHLINFRKKVMPVGGTVTRIDVRSADSASWTDAALPTGCTAVLVARKNGVEQDGTGGTTDTRITVNDAGSTYTWTGSLALAAGDVVDWVMQVAGTFGSFTPAVKTSACFEPTTSGDFLMGACFAESSFSGFSAVYLAATTPGGASATETQKESVAQITGWYMVAMRGIATGNGGDNVAFTMRVNLADASGASHTFTTALANVSNSDYFSLTLAGNVTNPGGSTTHIAAGDTWDVKALASQGKRHIYKFGQFITTKCSKVFAVALDGAEHVITEAGIYFWGNFKIGGAVDLSDATVSGLPIEDVRRTIYPLGGSRETALFSASAIEVPSWIDFVPRTSEFDDATVQAVVEVRTLNSGTSVTPKIRDMAGSDAVVGSACTATNADYSGTNQRQTLSFTPVAGHRYRLMLTPSNASAGVFGIGTIEAYYP